MKNILRLVLVLGAVGFGSFRAGAATWYVATNGSDAAAGTNWVTAKLTIQAAVDAAAASDTVLVTNGLYATGGRTIAAAGATTNRVVIDKAITVKSVNGPANTTIKGFWDPGNTNGIGPAAVRGVYLGTNAVLSGFTVTNGATRAAEYGGGGIHSENSGLVTNCVISGNSCDYGGGGVYGGTVSHSIISGNRVVGLGGGGLCNANADNCLILSNTSPSTGSDYFSASAAVWLVFGPNPPARMTLDNCTIVKNTSTGGGYLLASSQAYSAYGVGKMAVRNCVMWDNVNDYLNASDEDISSADFRNNCYRLANGFGTVTNNPQFVDSTNGNYQLKWTSPCRNSGSNSFVASATDLLGGTRIVNTTVDIGAYEAVNSDGDQLSNAEEAFYGTNPNLADSDSDGLDDDQEVYVTFTNPLLADSDYDDFPDGFEVTFGYSPTNNQHQVLVDYIRNNGAAFNLYSPQELVDVAVGQMGVAITGTNAALSLQLQQSADLGGSWTNAGPAVPWTMPVDDSKKFLRVRASP